MYKDNFWTIHRKYNLKVALVALSTWFVSSVSLYIESTIFTWVGIIGFFMSILTPFFMRNLNKIVVKDDKLLDKDGNDLTSRFPRAIPFFAFSSLWVAYFVQSSLTALNVSGFIFLFFFAATPFILITSYLTVIDCPISLLFVKYPSSEVFSQISGWVPVKPCINRFKTSDLNNNSNRYSTDPLYSHLLGNIHNKK
jgi:hypothetical protein